MRLNYYQYNAHGTVLPSAFNQEYLITGLAAEAGEIAGKYAKFIRDNADGITDEKRDDYTEAMKKEIGDLLWFVAILASYFGFTLEEIAQSNLDKLKSRKERGTLQGSGDNR